MERNKIIPDISNIKEGFNYPEGELDTLFSAQVTDQITEEIVKRVPKDLHPFIIFEVGAGVGMQTVSFLDNPAVKGVYSFQDSDENIPMSKFLSNNLEMYKLKRKSRVESKPFMAVPSKFENAVLYINPSWEDPRNPGTYITSNIKINGVPLGDIARTSFHCSLIVLNLPPKYRLPDLDGFSVETLIIRSEEDDEEVSKRVFLSPVLADEYDQKLHDFLFDFLEPVEANPKKRDLYITGENFETWKLAFTHQTFDRKNNYEELELIGDNVIKFLFAMHLMRVFPGIKKSAISPLQSYYLSEKYMPILTRKYSFSRLVRSTREIGPKLQEDIFESIFGALVVTGQNIVPGLGFIAVHRLSEYIFSDIEIELERGEGDARSVLEKNTLQPLGLPDPTQQVTVKDGIIKAEIILGPRALDFFRRLNIDLPIDGLIGSSSGRTKRHTIRDAYIPALKTLRNAGVTSEFVTQQVEQIKLGSIEGYLDVRKKYIANGYVSIMRKIDTSNTERVAQLVGVTEDGDLVVLAEYKDSSTNYNEVEAKKALFRNYLSS